MGGRLGSEDLGRVEAEEWACTQKDRQTGTEPGGQRNRGTEDRKGGEDMGEGGGRGKEGAEVL